MALLGVAAAFAEQREIGKPEIFAVLNGKVDAGIICDNRGNMFVGKNDELLRIGPDGKAIRFCSLADLPKGKNYYFPSPLIWDMVFDKDGCIVAAAQDRILKIAPDGAVATLIREDFDGFVGASGVELDQNGNLYVTSGNKILRYTPALKKTVFIETPRIGLNWEGMQFDIRFESFCSISFDPGYKNLYVSDLESSTLS